MKPTHEAVLAALARTDRLLPAPRVLSRALSLLRDPNSDLGEIATLISCDPALAADILRCANSAYYALPRAVSSIEDAMHQIGLRETVRMVNLVVARHSTGRDLGCYGIGGDDFWAESLFNGLFLENLAQHTCGVPGDEAYTCGLLRFIGRLAINQALDELGGGLFWDRVTPLPRWELEEAGLTQAQAGALLLRQWQFPESVVRAIAEQDQPPSREVPPLVRNMQFAAALLPSGCDRDFMALLPQKCADTKSVGPLARECGISIEVLCLILGECRERFTELRDSLHGPIRPKVPADARAD